MATGERLAAGIRGATLTRIAAAGHLLQLEAPVAVAVTLRSWLSHT